MFLVSSIYLLTPDKDRSLSFLHLTKTSCRKRLCFLVPCGSSYRRVHFSRAVLFCQPHQQLFTHSMNGGSVSMQNMHPLRGFLRPPCIVCLPRDSYRWRFCLFFVHAVKQHLVRVPATFSAPRCYLPTPFNHVPRHATLYTKRGALVCQWLARRTRDWNVAGSNPCRCGGRILFSRVNFLCWLLFWYPFHPRVTAVARKRPRSFCQKCRRQVTAKYACTLRIWLCIKCHGAWLYSVHRTCAETAAISRGTSHASAVNTPLRWIFKNAL